MAEPSPPPVPPLPRQFDVPDYRPLSRRRRALVALLAVATAIGVVLVLLHPPGGVVRRAPAASAVAPVARESVNRIVVVPTAPDAAASAALPR
jgi:hypothetical protein